MSERKLNLQKDSFTKYAVWPKCKTLYTFEECIHKRPRGEAVSAKCSNVEFPLHPHEARRQPCGTILMKTMRSRAGESFLFRKSTALDILQIHCRDLINKPVFFLFPGTL